jgi:two-component system sensor histidine kinase AauS
LANARDALVTQPPSSTKQVEVELTDRRGAVCYLFRDNGPGIHRDHRARIFEPFFTTKPGETGTGLGLALSKDIVARMGGSLELRLDDARTCFAVRLPVATPPGA